jgi:pyrroloquinoline-quinone synthase
MAVQRKLDAGAQQTEFVQRLRAVGARRYHDKHPFHLAMHAGVLTPDQIRGWVANRYYYQKSIPIKDAAILSNLPDREKRRIWIQRILDHDGTLAGGGGGIELWFALARAVGLTEEDVVSERLVAPSTRFAADAYVTFARTHDWVVAVASSLTELFAPDLMSTRIAVLVEKYPWIDDAGLAYFRTRLNLAPRDAEYALRWVVENATTPHVQDACVQALEFKCDVLWAILDATQHAYGAGGADQPST